MPHIEVQAPDGSLFDVEFDFHTTAPEEREGFFIFAPALYELEQVCVSAITDAREQYPDCVLDLEGVYQGVEVLGLPDWLIDQIEMGDTIE